MRSQLCAMFADASDPIVLISDGIIFYANHAALLAFGMDICGLNADAFFEINGKKISEISQGELLEEKVYIGEMIITVHCMWMEDILVLRATMPDTIDSEIENILSGEDASVRSPLSTLLATASILRGRTLNNKGTDSEKRTLFALMEKSIYRIMRVSGDISVLTALNKGTLTPRFESTELVVLMNEYAEKSATYLGMIGIKLRFATDKSQYIALVDEPLLEHLVYILIALCAKRPECTEIQFSFAGNDDFFCLEINDNGCCSAEEESVVYVNRASEGALKPTVSVPLAFAIAKAFDGNICFSYEKGKNGIHITIPKKIPEGNLLHSISPKMKYENGLDAAKLQLSDLLPTSFFEK